MSNDRPRIRLLQLMSADRPSSVGVSIRGLSIGVGRPFFIKRLSHGVVLFLD